MFVKINVRCLLVTQSALLHLHVYKICMNPVDLKMLLYNVCVKNVLYFNVYSELSCIILFIFNSFISPRLPYFLFLNKHCLIQLS